MTPLVHIGYHKTASSWLQQVFFPSLADEITLYEHPVIWDELMLPTGLEFDGGRCRQFMQGLAEEAVAGGSLPVFSSERLSGNPHSGGYDAAVMADRIRLCFDHVKILVVIREQRAVLASNYRQYIKMGGTCSLEEYLTPPWDGRVPLFRLDNFSYQHLVRYYHELFGKDAMLVLPYEWLGRSPQTFADRLLDFLDLPTRPLSDGLIQQGVNVSMNDLQLRLKRWVNYLSGNDSLHPVKPLAPGLAERCFRWISGLERSALAKRYDLKLTQRVEAVVGDHYADSNARLASLTGLDLADLGYRV
jgi:hypothetical protein